MKDIILLKQECKFKTERLAVENWVSQSDDLRSDLNFAEKVMRILTPRVTKSLPDGWQGIKKERDVQQWMHERTEECSFITVRLLSTNELIGFIFLYVSGMKGNNYDLRFGYLLADAMWGRGLGTELVQGLVNWCKTEGNIESLSGGVETDNIGSIKVLEKCGFVRSNFERPSKEVIFYKQKFNID